MLVHAEGNNEGEACESYRPSSLMSKLSPVF